MNTADSGDAEDGIYRSPEAHVRDVPAIVGANLRRLRKGQGFSLEKLAELSGVSRAMLGQIETAKSVPTVSLLWRVADALGVPVASLMATEREPSVIVIRRDRASVLVASEGRYATRSLAPANRARSTGFFEITFAPGHREKIRASTIGTHHNLVVARGSLAITVADEASVTLEEGDAIAFEASRHHIIENVGDSEASAFLVVVCSTA